MSDNTVQVRVIRTIEEYHRVEELQRRVWGMIDATDIVPLTVLLTAQKNGGLVAGAFDAQETMIGFVFGFIGMTKAGKFKHCSHMAGVLPEIRRRNIGYQLKTFQREYVLKQGFDLITWTYDPLESVNAALNIAKLGTIAHTYFHNHYGAWTDSLNIGLPTDRFEVEWWIDSQRVLRHLETEYQPTTYTELVAVGTPLVIETRIDTQGILRVTNIQRDLTAKRLLVEVPAEFQAIKVASMDAAREWRQQTAAVFDHYFDAGYYVSDFISDRDTSGLRRNFYLLTRHVPDLPGSNISLASESK